MSESLENNEKVLFKGEFKKGAAVANIIAIVIVIIIALFCLSLQDDFFSRTIWLIGIISSLISLIMMFKKPEAYLYMRTDQELAIYEKLIMYKYTVLPNGSWTTYSILFSELDGYTVVEGQRFNSIVLYYKNREIWISWLLNPYEFVNILEEKALNRE